MSYFSLPLLLIDTLYFVYKIKSNLFIGIMPEAAFLKHQTGCEMKNLLVEYFKVMTCGNRCSGSKQTNCGSLCQNQEGLAKTRLDALLPHRSNDREEGCLVPSLRPFVLLPCMIAAGSAVAAFFQQTAVVQLDCVSSTGEADYLPKIVLTPLLFSCVHIVVS